MKELIKAITPPVFLPPLKRTYSLLKGSAKEDAPDVLFDGDDALFKRTVGTDAIYAEYGCGASTMWVAKYRGCRIYSVDSSAEWIGKVGQACAASGGLTLHLADLGPVGEWGRPVSYDRSDNFADYTDWIWTRDEKPTVVLVDGRFRVCCFLTSLLKGAPGTRILFDDYMDRPPFHYVERYLKPVETCGRQALFVIPEPGRLDIDGIARSIEKFRFVID